MMVFALSGSVRAISTCRDSKVGQFKVVKSIGLSRFGLTEASASSRLLLGLFLHSASSANPKEASASPYMTCSPDLATEYPNSHITVLIESGCLAGSASAVEVAEAMISFSYLSQLKVARFSSPARPMTGIRQAKKSKAAATFMIEL